MNAALYKEDMHMDDVRQRQPVGSLKISQEVLATIAKVAALEIEGVASLADTSGRVRRFFSRGGISKTGIQIELSDDFAEVDIGVNLKFGAKITDVCSAIQTSVKDNIQTMTGMAVSKVNVTVAGIVFNDETIPAKQ